VSGDAGSEADVSGSWRRLGPSTAVGSPRQFRGGRSAQLLDISDRLHGARVNLVGAFILTKTVAPHARPRARGSIIHSGRLGTVAAPTLALASLQGGLNSSRRRGVELVQDRSGERDRPGTIDNAIGMGVPSFGGTFLKHRIPIGRAVRDDIAQVCPYLASDDSCRHRRGDSRGRRLTAS
jgi:hypothetical protein